MSKFNLMKTRKEVIDLPYNSCDSYNFALGIIGQAYFLSSGKIILPAR